MKSFFIGLLSLLSISAFSTTINQDFGVSYTGYIGKDGTYKTEFQFSVEGNPDLQYLFTNFFYNEQFQTQIDKRVEKVEFRDLGDGNIHAINKICAVGFCKNIHSNCTTEDSGDVLGRSCSVNFSKGDASDVLESDGKFGSLNEVYCDNKGGSVSCSFNISGKTKGIVFNSANSIARETIVGTYKNIVSVLVANQDPNATFPLEIDNQELKKLEETLKKSTNKEF